MKKIISLLLLTLIPSLSFALELDYYTYNGFTETVSAFTRLAIIFNDNQFQSMFAVAAVLGIALGGSFFFGKQVLNLSSEKNALGWLFMISLGVAIYTGLILPKGTVHVYDPVKNEYEAVGNVPDLMVLVSGVWNKVERAVAEIVDVGSDHPYSGEAGGISFKLLYNATSTKNSLDDYFLEKSLKKYYGACSYVAYEAPSYDFDMYQVKSGTQNLFELFGHLRSPSSFTQYYDANHKGGITLSCEEAWDQYLQPVLANANTYQPALETVCGKSGFNVNSQQQMQACQESLRRITSSVYEVNADHIHLLRNAVMSNAIVQYTQDIDPDVGTKASLNRSVMVDGIGTAMSAEEWLPTMRAVVLTIALGLMPVLCCFIVTPLAFKALSLIFGLFGWLALWGVSDIILHGIAIDQAYNALSEIKRHNMGFTAMLLSPEASMKAMAIVGKARSMGMTIASILAAGLFGFSAYSLANMAQNLQNTIDNEGKEASNQQNTPEGHARQLEMLKNGYATSFNQANIGHQQLSDNLAFNQASEMHSVSDILNSMQNNGMGVNDAAQMYGGMSAGSQIGSLSAHQKVAMKMGLSPYNSGDISMVSQRMSDIENMSRMGNNTAADSAAKSLGFKDSHDVSRFNSLNNIMHEAGKNESLMTIKDRFETHNDITMSDQEFFSMLGRFETLGTRSDIESVNGNENYLGDFLMQNKRMDIQKFNSFNSTARSLGTNINELAKAEGQFQAINSESNRRTLEELSPEEMIRGYVANAIMTGTKGVAWNYIANEYDGGLSKLMFDINEYGTENELARMLVFTQAAEDFNLSHREMALNMNGSNLSFTATPRIIDELHKNGLIDAQAAKLLTREGGGVVNASFGFTPDSHSIVTATTRSGISVTADNSYSDIDSQRQDYSATYDTSHKIESGMQMGTSTTSSLLLNKEEEDNLEFVLKTISRDDAARQNFIMNSANWLKSIGSSDENSSVTTGLSGSLGLNGSVSYEKNIGNFKAGAGLNAQGTGYINSSDTDSESFSNNYAIMERVFNSTEYSARRSARQETFEYMMQQRENGTPMSDDEVRDMIDNKVADKWADALNQEFTEIHQQYLNRNIPELN